MYLVCLKMEKSCRNFQKWKKNENLLWKNSSSTLKSPSWKRKILPRKGCWKVTIFVSIEILWWWLLDNPNLKSRTPWIRSYFSKNSLNVSWRIPNAHTCLSNQKPTRWSLEFRPSCLYFGNEIFSTFQIFEDTRIKSIGFNLFLHENVVKQSYLATNWTMKHFTPFILRFFKAIFTKDIPSTFDMKNACFLVAINTGYIINIWLDSWFFSMC